MRGYRGRATALLAAFTLLALCAAFAPSYPDRVDDPNADFQKLVLELEPGWRLRAVRRMPETVQSLLAVTHQASEAEHVYVGTGPSGGVYRFNAAIPKTYLTLGHGLGDLPVTGDSPVTQLAIQDVDQDGTAELFASTCQIYPSGPPRLYVWSIKNLPVLRAMARPQIASSWSHGLGFLPGADPTQRRVLSTFCGHGEVVEYHLVRRSSEPGFTHEGIEWKVVGQVPGSGEGLASGDVDNDGTIDTCIATGFRTNGAMILIHGGADPSASTQFTPRHATIQIDEDRRFGNVRFVIGDTRGEGARDLVAWWCTDIAGGECEIIRYRLDVNGVRERTILGRGDAGQLWPIDGQMAVADMNADGISEIWFSSYAGNLWRYDSVQDEGIKRICRIDGPLGPIATGRTPEAGTPALFIGSKDLVLQLEPTILSEQPRPTPFADSPIIAE